MRAQKARLVLDLVERATSSDVLWIIPDALGQDIYGPGSTIITKWTSSSQTIGSPSMQICRMSSSAPGDCSAPVQPEITESDGLYQAPITVPDALWDGSFFLRMMDDSGATTSSPAFFLHPGVPAGGSALVAGGEPQAQAPLGQVNPPLASVVSSLYFPASLSTTLPLPSASSQVAPVASTVLDAKTPPPPAAYAVPLSAVAALILVAGVFYLKQRRRNRGSQQSPARTSSCKSSSSGRSDVGHALRVLSRHYGYTSSPPPKAGLPPLDTFPLPAYAQWALPSPSYAHADSPRSPLPLPVEQPCSEERPRLPPIATTGSFMSARSDPATHAVLSDYLLPSPPLTASTSTPRCLLPAPQQQVHLRDTAHGHQSCLSPSENPLRNADRACEDRELYARVATKLSMYHPNHR
ncbi:hypothetical protein K438DRAFT_2018890 [Mycena galopus ATCC 62051]|nr:hypothetical protein K438DRAFT_2018890 [Mycena galopus ATCC 62051]